MHPRTSLGTRPGVPARTSPGTRSSGAVGEGRDRRLLFGQGTQPAERPVLGHPNRAW